METIYQKIKILNHAFCLMKLNGLKEEYCFSENAPKDAQMHIDQIKERLVKSQLKILGMV